MQNYFYPISAKTKFMLLFRDMLGSFISSGMKEEDPFKKKINQTIMDARNLVSDKRHILKVDREVLDIVTFLVDQNASSFSENLDASIDEKDYEMVYALLNQEILA